ncbi:MAG: AAA family ATPase [Acidimicrobiia bacterium]
MGDITLGIVASARSWRTDLQAHIRDHVTGVKAQILREPRMALEMDLDVIVIDDVSTFLAKSKVQVLQARGVRVVGIFDPDEQGGLGQGYLEQLGVDLALPSTTRSDDLLYAIEQLQPGRLQSTGDVAFDSIMADFDLAHPETVVPDIPTAHGRVIAVAGPSGGGATEVAIGLADALALRGDVALLVDADEQGPSVGRRLCYQLQPNILTAIDAALHQTHPLPQVVGRRIDHALGHVGFHVIPGIANPDDWSQLRSSDVVDLLQETRRLWGYTVVNAGNSLEDLSAYGFERFGASRGVVSHADLVVVVGAASPVGLLRIFEWLVAYRMLDAQAPVYVVLNRAPGAKFKRAQLEAQLYENLGVNGIVGHCFVGDDDRVADADWEGRLVANGAFTKAMLELANLIVPSPHAVGRSQAKAASDRRSGNKSAKQLKQPRQPKPPKVSKPGRPTTGAPHTDQSAAVFEDVMLPPINRTNVRSATEVVIDEPNFAHLPSPPASSPAGPNGGVTWV